MIRPADSSIEALGIDEPWIVVMLDSYKNGMLPIK